MHESLYDKRRLGSFESLVHWSAPGNGQFVFAPMRNINTSRRIERALDYCVRVMALLVGLLWNLKLQKSVSDLGRFIESNERRFIKSVQ